MTEAEWLTTTNTKALIDTVASQVSDRKFRLFTVAWCRREWDRIPFPVVKSAILTAENYCDGEASKHDLDVLFERVRRAPIWGWDYVRVIVWPASRSMAEGAVQFCRDVGGWEPEQWMNQQQRTHFHHELFERNTLLRDIVGNPFRPATFVPEWRTETALAIARTMYNTRDFSAMPILADALQDAGCDSDEVLNHCRDPQQVHVRGCWVVDLVLGKS